MMTSARAVCHWAPTQQPAQHTFQDSAPAAEVSAADPQPQNEGSDGPWVPPAPDPEAEARDRAATRLLQLGLAV